MNQRSNWKGPTIVEIAQLATVSTATVDRVLNGRSGVREPTRRKVLQAIEQLEGRTPSSEGGPKMKIAFIAEAGLSFIRLVEQAVQAYIASHDEVEFTLDSIATANVSTGTFAQLIEQRAESADGIILVAPEDMMINRVVRSITERGVPVVCLTTDLPNSNRSAYVGIDQVSAGSNAAFFMGRMLPRTPGKILLVISAPYRNQEEREIGFRRVLRSEFPHLSIEERVNSNDDSHYSYENVKKYINEHGAMAGIYNAAGGNRGIARALREAGLENQVLFIGHELSEHTRGLLDTGEMDIVLSHDVDREVAASVEIIRDVLAGKSMEGLQMPQLLYTRHSSF